jgi:hypothetical protein
MLDILPETEQKFNQQNVAFPAVLSKNVSLF